MMVINALWTLGRIGYRVVRLLRRALRELALVLWREA